MPNNQLKNTKAGLLPVLQVFFAGCVLMILLSKTISHQREKVKAARPRSVKRQLYLSDKEIEEARASFQEQKTELEMRLGSMLINRHFIANSLNSVNHFILQNDRFKASEYLSKFSTLLRLLLQHNESKFITLESELDSLQLYLELEALRLKNHFEYKISTAEDLDASAIRVPPFLMQPFVENAIWHGLMHKEDKGHVCLQLTMENDLLLCKITDDGVGRKKAAERKNSCSHRHPSMGMKITERRIALLLPPGQSENLITVHDLILPDGAPGGTEVVLKIPVVYD